MLFRTVFLCLVAVVSISCRLPGSAQAQDSITWMKAALAPFYLLEGELKNQGYGDVAVTLMQEHLAGYEHGIIEANIARHIYALKKGKKVCTAGLFRTPERESFIEFSIPSFFTLPAVIITTRDKLASFGNVKRVQLNEVLDRGDLVIGHSKERSYGIYLDEVLKKHTGKDNIFIFPGQEFSHNLFKMLVLGRLDGLIGLPDEAMFQAEQLGIRDKIVTITIEENQQGFASWLSAVGCSKNEWGKKVIADINRVLVALRATEQYRATYERWLDEASLDNYRQLYGEIFLQTTE